MSALGHLPHARYTVFMAYDPPEAVRSVSLIDRTGRGAPDWSSVPVAAGEVIAPLVQHELRGGSYQLRVDAVAGCAWMAQVVLNSMLSWEAPPRVWRPSQPPPQPINLRSGEPPEFRIARTGHYAFDLSVGGFYSDQHSFPERFCPFSLGLRAADGHRIQLAEGGEASASWPSWRFLGAGAWHVVMETECEWRLVVRPLVGPSGGGARWF